jgi:hypothetical protein
LKEEGLEGGKKKKKRELWNALGGYTIRRRRPKDFFSPLSPMNSAGFCFGLLVAPPFSSLVHIGFDTLPQSWPPV